jgi:hypothetical protein
MYILSVLILAFAGQTTHPQAFPNYPRKAQPYNEGPQRARPYNESPNIVPNGDFSQGNTGFLSGLPYVPPGRDALWGNYYTLAKSFNNPQLHTLISPDPFDAPFSKNTNNQVFFANAGGTGSLILYTTLVHCGPNTKYHISFDAISLSGSAWTDGHEIPSKDWVPNFKIIVNGDSSLSQHAGCGEYDRIRMEWNSGNASTATLSFMRMPIGHGGGLIGIANVRMVPDVPVPLD